MPAHLCWALIEEAFIAPSDCWVGSAPCLSGPCSGNWTCQGRKSAVCRPPCLPVTLFPQVVRAKERLEEELRIRAQDPEQDQTTQT